MRVPGFIDLQINGYKGVDFTGSDLTEEQFIYACQELFSTGTAAFLPTLVTSDREVYKRNLPLIAKTMDREEFKGKLLGIHLEGPFISTEPGAVGAHNPDWVSEPSIDYLKQLQQWAGGNIKMITIAAEVAGNDKLAAYASENGITVSLGHQMALEKDLDRLAKAGAKALTHLGNALPNKIDRHQNPIWAGLSQQELSAMLITDGYHLTDSMIKTIIKTKDVSGVIVTSDASAFAGMPAGRYEYWGQKVVLEENGYLHMPAKKCMAGSSATMLECMNYLASLKLLKEGELLKVGFYNPLELIGVDSGTIKSDYSVVYNKDKNVFEIER